MHATSSSCASRERLIFRTRCAVQIAEVETLHAATKGRLALSFTWHVKPKLLYWYNNVGVGKTLDVALRLHRLCYELRRFCYLSLYDAELEHYFGYASGASWALSKTELAAYGTRQVVSMDLNKTHASRERGDAAMATLRGAIEAAIKQNDAALIDVHVYGWLPQVWLGHDAHSVRKAPLARDRCLARYVTEPLLKGRYRSLQQRAAPTAVHLRTGFADAHDIVVQSVDPSPSSARLWATAACGERPFSDGHPRFIMSDSPGLLRQLESLPRCTTVAPTADAGVAATSETCARIGVGGRGLNSASTRTWNTNRAAKFIAFDDIVLAGLAESLHVAPQHGILRSGHLAAQQYSSFYIPLMARSMCIREIVPTVSSCMAFAEVFPRDLTFWMHLIPPPRNRSWQRGRAVNLTSLRVARPNRYSMVRDKALATRTESGHSRHPCHSIHDACGCYIAFVRALK